MGALRSCAGGLGLRRRGVSTNWRGVDVVEVDFKAARFGVIDQLAGFSGRQILPGFVMGNVALGLAKDLRQLGLRHSER